MSDSSLHLKHHDALRCVNDCGGAVFDGLVMTAWLVLMVGSVLATILLYRRARKALGIGFCLIGAGSLVLMGVVGTLSFDAGGGQKISVPFSDLALVPFAQLLETTALLWLCCGIFLLFRGRRAA